MYLSALFGCIEKGYGNHAKRHPTYPKGETSCPINHLKNRNS